MPVDIAYYRGRVVHSRIRVVTPSAKWSILVLCGLLASSGTPTLAQKPAPAPPSLAERFPPPEGYSVEQDVEGNDGRDFWIVSNVRGHILRRFVQAGLGGQQVPHPPGRRPCDLANVARALGAMSGCCDQIGLVGLGQEGVAFSNGGCPRGVQRMLASGPSPQTPTHAPRDHELPKLADRPTRRRSVGKHCVAAWVVGQAGPQECREVLGHIQVWVQIAPDGPE